MLKKKLRSFGYAMRGIQIAWREEFNFRFEVVSAFVAIGLSWFLGITAGEFIIVVVLIGFVLSAEAMNTAFEELCDKFQPTHDPHIAKIKDLAAAAVFIANVAALVAGCVIFIPYLFALTS
jgi:diacylglycerol kinase